MFGGNTRNLNQILKSMIANISGKFYMNHQDRIKEKLYTAIEARVTSSFFLKIDVNY
jgi:hypothetical protein